MDTAQQLLIALVVDLLLVVLITQEPFAVGQV